MGGAPIRQVNTILKHLSGVCSTRKLNEPRVITYDVAAEEKSLAAYLAHPPDPNNGTSFSCAYRAMTGYIQGYAARRREAKGHALGINFIFMSDGDASPNDIPLMAGAAAALKSAIRDLDAIHHVPVTVHVIGLGSDVKAALLTDVSRFGSIEGSFRYSVEAEGLGDKFVDLFEFGLAGTPCKLSIRGGVAVDGASSSSSASVGAGIRVFDCQARIVEDADPRAHQSAAERTTRRAETLAKLAAAAAVGGEGGANSAAQIAPIPELDAAKLPSAPAGATQSHVIECLISCDRAAPLSAGTAITVALAGSDRTVQLELGDAESAPSPLLLLSALEMAEPANAAQTADLMRIVGSMHTRGRSVTERVSIESQRQTLLDRLTACLTLFNAAAFQGAHGAEVSALRLKDLRSEHKFAKSRRARVMAMRENDNGKHMAAIEGKLDVAHSRLTPRDLSKLDSLAASGDWSCMLSLDSVAGLMRDTPDDFLCIGLLVEREESVVDSPQTGLKLLSVSSSLVSFNSFVDVMSSAVAEKGFAAVHGAFKNSKRGQVADINGANRLDIAGAAAEADKQEEDQDAGAYAFVGQAREKVNCVFPLYLCGAHNKRVSILKRVWLSHLFTLDALAYDKQQEIGAVALLSQMVSKFDGTERQAMILREVACVVSAVLTHSPSAVAAFPPERFTAFVQTIEGKARQHVPNLCTPIVMAWLGDDFGAKLRVKPDLGVPGGAPVELVATASSSSDASPASADLTLSDDLLCAVYLGYTQRLVRDGYAALMVDAHKIATRLLYGDRKPEAASSSSASSGAPAQAPFHVRQAAAIAEFAAWFYDPSESIPSLPVEDAAESLASASSQSIARTEDVSDLVSSLLPPMPPFLQRLLGGIDQLRAKWRTINKEKAGDGDRAAAGEAPASSLRSASASAVVGSASASVLSRLVGCLPYASDVCESRVEYFRRHLLSFYYYHNDSPPVSCTVDNVVSSCHARFVARASEKQAAAASAEQHNALATLLATADDLAAFGGLARFYCPTRNGTVFRLLVAQLIHRADKEKLVALLRNEINGIPLYDSPQLAQSVWIPAGLGLMTQIRALVGAATLSQIAAEHRAASHSCTHLYRPSDLPNRQGHCNSNPWPHHKRQFVEYH